MHVFYIFLLGNEMKWGGNQNGRNKVTTGAPSLNVINSSGKVFKTTFFLARDIVMM